MNLGLLLTPEYLNGRSVKSDKGKGEASLLKKLQDANDKLCRMEITLSQAQNDAKSQSSKLCNVLSTLKKYEDGNEALARALNDIEDLKLEMDNKNEHVEDLVNVINKLEMLNSYQEMEILTLREKLGIPEDESISIKNIVAKRKEKSRKMEEFIQLNKSLVEENFELKADVRILKYKLSKFEEKLDISDNFDDCNNEFLHSTKLMESEIVPLQTDVSKLNQNIRILVEENEALRTGMHEIMDSIRSQDGKSEVEIQSDTLERLLEALDVRHLAGWYHPAMRLQEHLNVVQGSNAELRSQIKILRKELQKKDNLLQDLAINKNKIIDVETLYKKRSEEDEIITMHLAERKVLEDAYKNEAEEWEKHKDLLIQENNELKDEVDDVKKQLEIYQENWQIIQDGDDEIEKALALKTREYADAANKIIVTRRKNTSLQQLLNKETGRLYECQKDIIKKESDFNRALIEAKKHNKILLSEISLLRSNLHNSVSVAIHNELKEKYEQLNIRHRALLEVAMVLPDYEQVSLLKAEMEAIRREKYQLVENLQKTDDCDTENSDNLRLKLKEVEAMKLIESQRADQMSRLHGILETQLAKREDNVKRFSALNSEQQEKLIELHKTLFGKITQWDIVQADDNRVRELQNEKMQLITENESLTQMLEIAQEEARSQYSLNSLQMLELDNLRHQILDLQAVSEDKTTISRLDFELASKKVSEMELTGQKTRLQNELSFTRQELDDSRRKYEEMRSYVQEYRKQCDNRCKYYMDVIYFLQCQYAGSTSISALENVIALATKLKIDGQNLDAQVEKTKKSQEDMKSEQQLLSVRLEIVERLKDMLEQQIGAGNVQNIMEHFAETSQQTLNDFKYKRRISYLEHELQIASRKFNDYESTITSMEQDMLNIQRAWHQPQSNISRNLESKSVQAATEMQEVSVQTDSYDCCLNKKLKDTIRESEEVSKDGKSGELGEMVEKTFREAGNNTEKSSSNSMIYNEQLDEALKLASERSAILVKYEAQLMEYKVKLDTLNKATEEKDSRYEAKIEALNKMMEEKNSHLTEKQNVFDELISQFCVTNTDCTDKLALKSTINSLQKLISQKEGTILRYQNLLKEDREEHSRITSHLQDEIKSLHDRILAMQGEIRKENEGQVVIMKNNFEKASAFNVDESTSRAPISNAAQEDIARLREKVSTLEAELNTSRELSGRWQRLAEERLKHIDHTRERLGQQHKNELDSYRDELNKWQSEADVLRQQLSDNRVLLAKGNISLMKELQEKDDKIQELNLACQQLQNGIELMKSVDRTDTSPNEIAQCSYLHQTQQHGQVDLLRRQLQSLMQKEKMYKYEITDLKQRLSRRYMATKTQERKTLQREGQLERKVISLEEELHKTKIQLDEKYLAQEAKKAKTAEELSLWEKQKKWQQTAEKLKENLKEKTNEYEKLRRSYEKLRSVVSCIEREKWYLRSKLKLENDTVFIGNLSSRPISNDHRHNAMEELEKECRILRERVKELTDRLEKESNEHLMLEIAELKRHNTILETVSQDNTSIINQLEKLEMTKDALEKTNLKLESENFELRLELEKLNSDTPGLREKVEHMEKYIKLLKAETSSNSTPRTSDKELNMKKSTFEMEKTIFTLKRIIEKLQAENKRLKFNSKRNHFIINQGKANIVEEDISLQRQYEESQKRVISLESDLCLAEHRLAMLQKAEKEDDNGDLQVLKQQLIHKSKLLEKVKQLLTRAVTNEKALRQRVQQLELKQTMSTIPECYVTPPTPE
ncbi:centrosomal protein of 290 kDa isoform X2 [Ooceraea biroi]|uniref:centrosomal protein of 290 kDa isoform X2 n=1 Tax=Ooceraea biroi TaxID=2015173 RepID=UPI0005B863D2|nr:centrosomal protein of 290 kDa isoform X2 [Ooceraea biroi]